MTAAFHEMKLQVSKCSTMHTLALESTQLICVYARAWLRLELGQRICSSRSPLVSGRFGIDKYSD